MSNTIPSNEVQQVFLPQLISPIKGDWGIMMSSCCCLYSLKLINNINFRFVSEREIISEDVYSLLKLYKDVRCVSIIDKTFYNYCVNEASLTHTYRTDRYEKIKHFYLESLKLCKKQEYNEDVSRAMQGPYLSFTIAAIKQIAKSDEKFSKKMSSLRAIMNDETLQKLLRSEELWVENAKHRILFAFMRKKSIFSVYMLAVIK